MADLSGPQRGHDHTLAEMVKLLDARIKDASITVMSPDHWGGYC
jgi:hypothetical protein